MVITFTTDFGTRDGYVGAMKGRLLDLCPDARIVDIAHDIGPQDIRGAAACIERASVPFPPGTVHVVVVDPGVGSRRHGLAVQSGGQWFIGPDNGCLDPVIARDLSSRVFRLHRTTAWWSPHPSFDGLHVFTPAAACVAQGTDIAELAEPTDDWVRLETPKPRPGDGGTAGQVIQFDRFGNALTNIHGNGIGTTAHCGGRDIPVKSHYGAVAEGEVVAIVNSDGHLEIAVRNGSARNLLGLSTGDAVRTR